jgi:hypothetical protein
MDYQITDNDKAAIVRTAQQLGVTPTELGAVLQRESGMNPNIWGGQGGNYYGAIQFGGPERREAGLDPNKIGNYSLAEQMPHVKKWLGGRGYEPGMGVDRLYNTILGGNPNANMNKRDSFGNSVNSSLSRFRPGGSDYDAAQQKLGDLTNYAVGQGGPGLPQLSYQFDEDGNVVGIEPNQSGTASGDTYNTTINVTQGKDKANFMDSLKKQLMGQAILDQNKKSSTSYDPMSIVQQYTGMNLKQFMPGETTKEETPGYLDPATYLNLINK